MRVEKFVCEVGGERLDAFLSSKLNDLTRSAIKKLIESEFVTVNGRPTKAGYSVKANDEIAVTVPDPVSCEAKPEDIDIDIIYEDSDFAIINKAQGMTVHMGNGNVDGTLVNALLFHLDSLSGVGGVIRPGIVHRIDKDTSGLLVVAKNDKAHLSLSQQIADKTCHRIYWAILEGIVKEDSGKIETYIGRSTSDRTKMAIVSADKGKYALTYYRVLKRFNAYTLCEFSLATGRTHQIRVHSKYISHPILGDEVYGHGGGKFNLKGQLLHAKKLILTHPTTGEEMTFEAPLPDYFREVIEKLGGYEY